VEQEGHSERMKEQADPFLIRRALCSSWCSGTVYELLDDPPMPCNYRHTAQYHSFG
jgi:hypothetical protein